MEQEQKEVQEEASKVQLEKNLTAFSAWALAFGGVIGFGAFVMPGSTFLRRAGIFGSLIALEIGAVIMLIISYGYGYMTKKFPISGGQFMYAERAFGKTHGFICAWFLALCYISIIPMDATALCLVLRAMYGNLFQFGFSYDITGYEVYLGEFLISLAAIAIFAYVALKGISIAGLIQSVMVIVMLIGLLSMICGAFWSPNARISHFHPLFYPGDKSILSQIISVLVVTPWLFVGFDIVPQLTGEANFSNNRIKVIMDTCIIAGCFTYIVIIFISASILPEGYATWVDYINDLHTLDKVDGFISITTFYASYKILGTIGVYIIGASAVCAVLTGVLCFYIATSRLLYSMSKDELIAPWFSVLNKNGVPSNAVLFCMIFSMAIALLGHVIGWTVDMASIGGAVGYGYTSLAACKFSMQEKRKDVAIFGMFGFAFSVIFAILLLVPIPGLDSSLSMPSYIMLVA